MAADRLLGWEEKRRVDVGPDVEAGAVASQPEHAVGNGVEQRDVPLLGELCIAVGLVAQSSSLSSAVPEKSPLAIKPRAPLASIRGP